MYTADTVTRLLQTTSNTCSSFAGNISYISLLYGELCWAAIRHCDGKSQVWMYMPAWVPIGSLFLPLQRIWRVGVWACGFMFVVS